MPNSVKPGENDAVGRHPHYLHELPLEDEERLGKLFTTLDKDGNGKIDIKDLSYALKKHGVHHHYAEKFLKSTRSKSGDISLADFIYYVREHEKNLRLHFSNLDKNKDGRIDLDELIRAFSDLGIPLDQKEATKLLQRMDQDGSLNISYDEWRDFLLLAPSSDIHQLINYWRHSTYLDIGEDMNIPDDFTIEEKKSGSAFWHLVAGGLAGGVSRTCTAPMDRLRVFLQVQKSKQRILDCFKQMLKEGGVRGLWRGNGVNVIKIAPETALKFMIYELIKKQLKGSGEDAPPLKMHERFVAGSLAGACSQTIIYPLEVLKTRMALRTTGQYKNILVAAQSILRKEGMRAFYRGYVPNLLGILPYAGTDLAVYETLRRRYELNRDPNSKPNMWLPVFCGCFSSGMGQLCSYPLGLVRTRLQAAATPDDIGMVMMFRSIIKREGFFGLYRGITPNFIKVLPAVSISYLVYEHMIRTFGVTRLT